MNQGLSRELIALRASKELHDGMYVNLGIGLPTLVSNFIDDLDITLQSENGILGYGNILEKDFDPDFINAGGQPVEILPEASFFNSAESFAMIRGGHIDVAILGGLQVAANGDLANWFVPERGGGSIGGAMDIAVGAKRLIITMAHTTKDGKPRILDRCLYPLTAETCVDLIITDLAVIEIVDNQLILLETAPGITVDEVLSLTEADMIIGTSIREMSL
ncbi:MAG: 3-oxoacid CoA-transferase subunit B [Chloroflexi bacterium]|jgi:3-oxoacid CoA-transferase subunit B|nr:MAG: 3-oxoacid CoA-transferase subunit B [Chloroflexota bacterium]|tara:strand:- start:1886 stop:2542 length:657 start_codon:yes stop_codon:yes gene_type:complete